METNPYPGFGYYDSRKITLRSRRHLPHWEQDGCAVFVTFRTADSIPGDAMAVWMSERNAWLKSYGLPVDVDRQTLEAVAGRFMSERLDRYVSRRFQRALDKGVGDRVLANPRASALVEEALRSYEQTYWALDAYVIMPNHVHAILQMRSPDGLLKTLENLKRFTAREINRLSGRTGTFWATDAFDHLIRSPFYFRQYRNYIFRNPRAAGLKPSMYRLGVGSGAE